MAWVMFLITLGGWAAALVVAKLLRSSVIRGPSTPFVLWRSHANLFYTNWLNYYVYQNVPYDIQKIPQEWK